MKDCNTRSIRNDNLRTIINILLNNTSVSRAQISNESGLSLMTVGKAANELCEMDVLKQTVSNTGSMGRRAGLLSLNKKKYTAVLYVSDNFFELNIVNLMFDFMIKIPHNYNHLYYFDQNLIMFLRDCSAYARSHHCLKDCIGISIISGAVSRLNDTTYDGDNSADILTSTASEILNFSPVMVMPAIKAAASYQVSKSIEDYHGKNVMYMYFSKEYAGLEIISHGMLLNKGVDSLSSRNLYDLIYDSGNYLKSKLEYATCINDVTAIISTLIFNCSTIVNPDEILLESTLYECNLCFIEGVRDILKNKFGLKCPVAIVTLNSGDKNRSAITGATAILRDRWINSCINK